MEDINPAAPNAATYAAAIERMEAVIAGRKVSSTYSNEYKKLLSWVIEEHEEHHLIVNDACFITRLSVDTYFEKVVLHRNGNRNTATRIAQALQWFYSNVENPTGKLVIRNPTVNEALRKQQDNYRAKTNVANAGTDPHKGLKDLISESDKRKLLTYIYETRPDSSSLGMSFNWGKNTGIRGASSRSCVYADLNLSLGFGPEREAPINRTILMVLRKGSLHKDNYSTDKQVGCQRHKEYLQCAIFSTAVCIIEQLRTDAAINFYHDDKDERATWWDTPLLEFETLQDESHAMRDVFNSTGVESCKLTHHRTHAVQYAGSEGLAPWQINTLTKHMLEKFHSAYQSEVDKESLKVMSGFSRDESRFVPVEHLALPYSIEYYLRALLPKYPEWVQQMESVRGDKSSCCRKFLLSILPFLVEVLVQDGIYFTRDFPRHPVSEYLKVSSKTSFFLLIINYLHTCVSYDTE
jgi:hypothetical protein